MWSGIRAQAVGNPVVPPPPVRACCDGADQGGRRGDWPAIRPFLHEIVAAGETFPYPPDLGEDQARDLWLVPPPGRTVVAVDEAGTVLGSANMYANRGGNGSHVASASYMVDPAKAGRGLHVMHRAL
jgi:hypothetical protein